MNSAMLKLAYTLAVEDLSDRFRRSILGVIWLALTFAAVILIKVLVFEGMFDNSGVDYISHLTIGLALFGCITTCVAGGANLFVANRTWILSTDLPYVLFMHSLILRALIELAIIAALAIPILMILGELNPGALWTIIPAMMMFYLTAISVCLVLAPIGARYRDLIHATQTVMRMLFFATPIIWIASPGTQRAYIASFNPVTHYIEIIRQPIMTGAVPLTSWLICIAFTFTLFVIGIIIFKYQKKEVPYWL
jgi:ABC-type polysaccharide/polyol phosphate export permease